MKLLKIFSKENFQYRRLRKTFKSPLLEYKKSFKKVKLGQNIVWYSAWNLNVFEFIVKKFITLFLYITLFNKFISNKKKAAEMTNRVYQKFTSKSLRFIPISNSFYFLVSFVPIVLFIYIFLDLISFNNFNFKDYFTESILVRIIPNINQTLTEFKSHTNGVGKTSIVLLLLSTLWISSRGYGNFIRSQNHIYNHKHSGALKLTNRLKGFFIVFAICLYISVFVILSFLVAKLFGLLEVNSDNFTVLKNVGWSQIFFMATVFIFLYSGIFLLLKFSPSFKLKWSQINSGVLTATIPTWMLISGFGWISTTIINYNNYGSLGIFMYLSIFVSLLSNFLFLGITINESYYKSFVSQRTFAKRVIFK